MLIAKYVTGFLASVIEILAEMAPYLLLGFLIAGLLHAFLPQKTIFRFLGRTKFGSALNAALLGVPLPLCSCGVIPTGMSLYKNGASKGATVSFLISTPQTGVDSILVTYSLLGLPFAILRPIVAFVTGVFGGYFTAVVEPVSIEPVANTENGNGTHKTSLLGKLKMVFDYGFVEFLQDISKWLIIGVLLAAVISVMIPDNFFIDMGLSPIWQMLIVLAFSVPLYICATASVPLAAVLMLKGLSPGAALVLLMAGPATNAATITVLGNVLGKRTLFTYLASIIGGALLFGFLIDYVLPAGWFSLSALNQVHIHHHEHGMGWLQYGSAIALTLLILNGYRLKYFQSKTSSKTSNAMSFKTYTVEGMNCNHCKNNVETNLQKLDFVTGVTIDLATNTVVVDGQNIDDAKIAQTVNGLGYKFVGEKK